VLTRDREEKEALAQENSALKEELIQLKELGWEKIRELNLERDTQAEQIE
jgi:hypothetical protein